LSETKPIRAACPIDDEFRYRDDQLCESLDPFFQMSRLEKGQAFAVF
jgi:hypothetical protein